ncbi:hypothetical protein V5N11_006519 [Cardamine amara subsp. amara]|uniref:Integrase zinc-binding domain-containing protein n=1 Tax=Cardamine amara subsp. amara TaxID=228776 RepID=A0ABD1B0R7_CARAN
MSRYPYIKEFTQLALTTPLSIDKEELERQIRSGPELGLMVKNMDKGMKVELGYTLQKGLLYKIGCLVILTRSPFIPKLFEQFHSSAIGGHEGALINYKRLTHEVYHYKKMLDFLRFIW